MAMSVDFTVDVVLDLTARNKHDLLRVLASHAAARLGRPEAEIFDALDNREKIGSTALGNGIALPHAQLNGSFEPLVIFARLTHPINFEARDEVPVDLVFAVLWPSNAGGLLDTMSTICRGLRDPGLLRRLRASRTPEDVVSLVHIQMAKERKQSRVRPDEPW